MRKTEDPTPTRLTPRPGFQNRSPLSRGLGTTALSSISICQSETGVSPYFAEDKGLEPPSQLSSGTALAVQRSKPISAYPPCLEVRSEKRDVRIFTPHPSLLTSSLVRVAGLEPTPSVWKTVTLPLRHTRHSMWAGHTRCRRFFGVTIQKCPPTSSCTLGGIRTHTVSVLSGTPPSGWATWARLVVGS